MLHNVTDATIQLAGVWFLVGWGLAWLLALLIWRPSKAHRHARRLQQTIDEQTTQIGELYRAADRLAFQLAEAKGQFGPTGRVA